MPLILKPEVPSVPHLCVKTGQQFVSDIVCPGEKACTSRIDNTAAFLESLAISLL